MSLSLLAGRTVKRRSVHLFIINQQFNVSLQLLLSGRRSFFKRGNGKDAKGGR